MMPSLEKSIAAISPIEDQALKALIMPDADFDNAVANASKPDIEDIAVSPMQGQYIALQARLIGAKTVLEMVH
ncbi:hypothetical protein PWT90_02606 [Aphanocladium album]|nr:hypothetical protein PWT90_02606 [Aphanocladium album]